jgi:uncharacterized protein
MPEDLMRYDLLAQDALRGVVRAALAQVARTGLPGEHHLFIALDTRHPEVQISDRLRQKYPEEITIVLQHQYWNLEVRENDFSVELSFDNVLEKLVVPYAAIKGFFDPAVQFGLQFETRPAPRRSRSGRSGGETGRQRPGNPVRRRTAHSQGAWRSQGAWHRQGYCRRRCAQDRVPRSIPEEIAMPPARQPDPGAVHGTCACFALAHPADARTSEVRPMPKPTNLERLPAKELFGAPGSRSGRRPGPSAPMPRAVLPAPPSLPPTARPGRPCGCRATATGAIPPWSISSSAWRARPRRKTAGRGCWSATCPSRAAGRCRLAMPAIRSVSMPTSG